MNKRLRTGNHFSAYAMALAVVAAFALMGGRAEAIPAGWTCTGSCGTSGANGVVTLPPNGASSYDWISTNNGLTGVGEISSVGGKNGTLLKSNLFSATAGTTLQFYFNYVTSDGAGYADYAWAALANGSGSDTYLVTARTEPSGSIIPGVGLPSVSGTLSPSSVAIIGGAPDWSPLGVDSSGECYDSGCGYTGWVKSDFTIGATGNYQLLFGVTNWNDTAYDSGMAISGATIGGTPITAVPEPSSLGLFAIGVLALLLLARKRRLL